MDKKHITLSVVIPVLNESGNVAQLYRELISVLKRAHISYEIIFVNDGSTDGTDTALLPLSDCTVVTMRRSFGQTASLMAGFDHAKGEYIATLDGDLQNDPEDLIPMFEIIGRGDADFVIGWRQKRHDSWDKKIPSYLAFLLRQVLLHDRIHDAGCGIKVFTRDVISEVELYGEMHRFFASIAQNKGFVVKEIAVNHRARSSGTSKYTWKRGMKGFLDMIAVWFWGKFSARPLHVLGAIGLVIIFCSVLGFSLALGHWFRDFGFMDTQRWFTFSSLMFVLGIQLVVSGLIADIAVRGYFAAGKRKTYVIKSVQYPQQSDVILREREYVDA
jgi:glycosyltransferase involved in cell wall biosynthesis